MADSVFVSDGFVRQISWPSQFKPIFLLIEQQQAFNLGQSFPEGRRQLGRRLDEFFKSHIQRNLFVRGVGKRLDLLDSFRQPPRARHLLKLRKRMREARR